MLHSGDDLRVCKRPESRGSHDGASRVVICVNHTLKYCDEGCLHVFQSVVAILIDLPPLLGDFLFIVCERIC